MKINSLVKTITPVLLACAFWQLNCPAAPAPVADPVLATGKGFEVKRSQLEDAFLSYSASVAANGGSIAEDQRSVIRSNLLQHLIVTHILTEKASAEDKVKTKKMVQDSIDEARHAAPSKEAFERQIAASGMTLSQVEARAYEEQLCRRVLERETTNGVTISDADVRKFYDENPTKFEEPEEVRVAHILVSTMDPVTQTPMTPDQKKAKEKLARQIRDRAVKGEDFGALVKQYSDDPGSKSKGGEYKFPRKQMVPEFEAASFSLQTNQISDLVETQYGYHIIKSLQKYPARKEPFDEVKPRIKEYLVEKEGEKKLPAYLAQLKAEAGVKVMDNGS